LWKSADGNADVVEDAPVELAQPQVYPSNIAQGLREMKENLRQVSGWPTPG